MTRQKHYFVNASRHNAARLVDNAVQASTSRLLRVSNPSIQEMWLLYRYKCRSCKQWSKPWMTEISFSVSQSCERLGQPSRPWMSVRACSSVWLNVTSKYLW